LRELARISKYVLIEVPLEDNWRIENAIDNTIGHINFYRRETALSLVRSVGLRVVDCRVFDVSAENQVFRFGVLKGLARHVVRRTCHYAMRGLAEKLFTYNFTILATRDALPG
jgi:hypothetical protein